MSAEPVSEIDDMSTTRLGRALPVSTPPAPNRISFRSSVVDTMVKTVSQWAIADLSHHLGTDLGQRIGLRRGPVPDRQLVAGLDQAGGHGLAHAAEPDPADFVRRFAHYDETSKGLLRFSSRRSLGGDHLPVHVSSPFPACCTWFAGGRRPGGVWWQPAQQRGVPPSRRPLCRRALGFDRGTDG